MYRTELPKHGIPSFISELTLSPLSSVCGKSVRIIGRVEQYDAMSNRAILSEPNNSSGKLLVDASFTDAENYIPGSLVMLIGELDAVTECRRAVEVKKVNHSDAVKDHVEPLLDRIENSLDDACVIEAKKVKRDDVTKDRQEPILDRMQNSLDAAETHRDASDQEVSLILIARVSHCVDRLDYNVFYQAVQVWRDLEEQ